MEDLRTRALRYHSEGRPGKVSVVPTKPCATSDDLALAYTPGVAKPVLEIEKDPIDAYKYTSKGNLVAVISNGTAILGLGDRGALASKPVMEGKGVLFKRFADIDVFDIEVAEKDPEKFVGIVAAISPTFGGINLEDIKGPECFYIERELIKRCDIPVFHDDQHGTAVIATAALINGLEVVKKDIGRVKVVVSGAGAAGLSVSKMFLKAGVKLENLYICDIDGLIYEGRKNVNEEQRMFALKRSERTLGDVIVSADVFMGLSAPNVLKPEMLLKMNHYPLVFAMANPDPEITYELATSTRDDVVMATGRSDYPNQINNCMCFPALFRGALDVRAKAITENMKMAATKALSSLAHLPVPEEVKKAYGGEGFSFGRTYILPKPFDPRILPMVATAVAKAAMEDGVARVPIEDFGSYGESLEKRVANYR